MNRIIGLYVLPLASLGMIGWAASTNAPPPVLVAFVALLGWPALSFARRQGWIEGAREARAALRPAREEPGDGAVR